VVTAVLPFKIYFPFFPGLTTSFPHTQPEALIRSSLRRLQRSTPYPSRYSHAQRGPGSRLNPKRVATEQLIYKDSCIPTMELLHYSAIATTTINTPTTAPTTATTSYQNPQEQQLQQEDQDYLLTPILTSSRSSLNSTTSSLSNNSNGQRGALEETSLNTNHSSLNSLNKLHSEKVPGATTQHSYKRNLDKLEHKKRSRAVRGITGPTAPSRTLSASVVQRDLVPYHQYRARQRRDASMEGECVWDEELEEAFMEGLFGTFPIYFIQVGYGFVWLWAFD